MHTRTTVTLPGCRRRQCRCGHGGKADMPSKVGFGAPSPQAKITICSTSAVIKVSVFHNKPRMRTIERIQRAIGLGKPMVHQAPNDFHQRALQLLLVEGRRHQRLLDVVNRFDVSNTEKGKKRPPSRDASLNRLRRCEELFPVGGQVGVFFYEAGGRINDQRISASEECSIWMRVKTHNPVLLGVFFTPSESRFQAPVVIGAISSGRAEWQFPVVPMFLGPPQSKVHQMLT
ncbi:hypothetical protein B0H11DRAFT_2306471 [Mycena galericulata]|nr:hypothetical protein B0H11DRAFT_2306471 [Mycena galericulata]